MKSEILVKSTAGLDAEIEEEMKSEDKSLGEILDAEVRPDRVPRSSLEDNGESKEEEV